MVQACFIRQPDHLLAIINFIALFLTARVEEGEMINKFGDDYRGYMKQTKMFFSFFL